MKTSLIIMAAGVGSRYGAGIKQLATMDNYNSTIMDYSVHDAIEAGFNKVIFIIRKDIEDDFKKIVGNRIEKYIEVEYAYQSLDDLPEGFESPKNRTKPRGTVHAIFSARKLINEAFLIINADDYYGKEAFKLMHKFLHDYKDCEKLQVGMAGYRLKNTLSDNGSVTRGICIADQDQKLKRIIETHELEVVDKKIKSRENLPSDILHMDSLVSMNMWASYPKFVEYSDNLFEKFLEENKNDLEHAEYVLPSMIDTLIQKDLVDISIFPTDDKWIGITYKEDYPAAKEEFRKMIDEGIYKENLRS